jgi:Protein of unknown function (DUF3800)
MLNEHECPGRALGGGPLLGSRWVRQAFLDETGVSESRDALKQREEPTAVVAGVVLHGDTDFPKVESKLIEIVASFPEQHVKRRFIHTAELYGGYGPFTKQNGWDEQRRFDVLAEIADIPGALSTPIVWGACDKADFVEHPEMVAEYKSANRWAHVMAAADCSGHIERYMREYCVDEYCSVVMENNDHARQLLKDQQRFLKNPPDGFINERNANWFPLTRVRGTPQFEEKNDCSVLQLADFCCLVIKRRLMNDAQIAPFYDKIKDMIMYVRREIGHPLGVYFDIAKGGPI